MSENTLEPREDSSTGDTDIKEIESTSFSSVYVETYDDEGLIEKGSGFLVEAENCIALVTNRHILSGKLRNTNIFRKELRAIPKSIKVHFYTFRGPEGKQILYSDVDEFSLYGDDLMIRPKWFEHPKYGALVDIAVIPMRNKPESKEIMFPYQVIDQGIEWKEWKLGEKITVLGYPHGLRATLGAVWIAGHIATDPALLYQVDDELIPAFLIDSRTRSGASGSPVVGRLVKGDSVTIRGNEVYELTLPYLDFFMGIYSGRINKDSDLGYVWRPSLVRDIISLLDTKVYRAADGGIAWNPS